MYHDEWTKRTTLRYGFPGALVACPVAPTTTTTTTTTGHGGGSSSSATTITKKQLASAPGVAWSYGGNGNCEGTGGYADVADGYPGLYGDGTGGSSTPQLTHSLTQDSTPRFNQPS